MPETISSGSKLDQPERGEAHAVHGRAVGGEAAGAVAELDLLDPERLAGGDAARGGAAVRVRARSPPAPCRARSSSARRIACRPVAPMPSSFVSRTFNQEAEVTQ